MPIAADIISNISFTSIKATGADFRATNPGTADIAPALSLALGQSSLKALRLTKGILKTSATKEAFTEEADAILDWARAGGKSERQTMAKALRQNFGNAGNVVMVHQIAKLTRPDARAFMQDYFASGGDMRGVAEWLSHAGGVLRDNRAKAGTAGFVGDAIDFVGGVISDAADVIVEGVEGVFDAIVSAGRTIAELAAEVVQWTIQEVGDLMESLLEVGRNLGQIFAEALQAGAEILTKFVRAAIEIGRTIGDVLVWGVTQTASVLRTIFNAIVSTVSDIADVVAWAAGRAVATVGQVLRTLLEIGRSVGSVIAAAVTAAADVLQAVVRGFISIGRSIGTLLVEVINRPRSILDALMTAMRDIGQSLSDMLGSVVNAAAGVLERVVEAARRIGNAVADLVSWLANQAAAVAERVLRVLLRVGERLVDILAQVTALSIGAVRQLVGAVFEIGRTLVGLMHEVFTLSVRALGRILRAAFELGRSVAEFIGGFVTFTYRACVRLARAAFEAGLTIAQMMGEVVGETYFVFRRLANAILNAAGPVGDFLQWVLDTAENTTSTLWRQALLAIRFAGTAVFDALDWAIDQGEAAFEAMLRAWEDVEETLISAYDWIADNAVRIGDFVFTVLGRVTTRIGNSIDYVLNFFENNVVEGARLFARGLLQAGYALGTLMADLANQSTQLIIAVTRGLIDVGATTADLLVATLRQPDRVLDNVLVAMDEAGRTIDEVFEAAVDIGEDAVEDLLDAWDRAQVALSSILAAAWQVGGGAFGVLVSLLINRIASARPLSPTERADARFVFGNALDLDRIFISAESIRNDIIFDIQNFFDGTPQSRAFVTSNLINIDTRQEIEIDDAGTIGLDRRTFIHEMTHVWQAETEGPLYLSEAIHAHATTADAYDYGNQGVGGQAEIDLDAKTPPTRGNVFLGAGLGEGGRAQLTAANGDLSVFNPEQQGEIISHWFTRARLNPTTTVVGTDLTTTDWDPFIATVRVPT